MSYVVLTGASSGIGLALSRLLTDVDLLALQGPEHAPPDVPSRPGVHYFQADYRRLDDVPKLAAEILELGYPDIVINNAAIPGPRQFERTQDEVEEAFQVNYLAGALLTDLLLDGMSVTARIINTASATHFSASLNLDDLDFERERYSPVVAYARSKLAVVTASRSLAARIPQTVISIHPGVISTNLLHAMFGAGGDTVARGASNLLAATTVLVPSGAYLDERRPADPNPIAEDPVVQRRLHAVTSDLVGRAIR